MAQKAEVFIPETIGERLRFIRERRRISQREAGTRLAKMGFPIHQSMLARFERYGDGDPNSRRPGLAVLLAISEILDVKLSQLGVTEEEYPELRYLRNPAFVKKHIHP